MGKLLSVDFYETSAGTCSAKEFTESQDEQGKEIMKTLEKVLEKKLQNPAFKKEWEALEPEFRRISRSLAKQNLRRFQFARLYLPRMHASGFARAR